MRERVRGWTGKTTSPLEPVQPFDDPPEPWLLDVRLPVDRRDDIRAGLVGNRKARAGDRGEDPRRISHDVADDVDAPHRALRLECLLRPVVGAEQEPSAPVDFDPVHLLRHGQVAAAQPGLDVCKRDGRIRGCLGTREGRVRVPVDEHDVRRFLRDSLCDRRPHLRDVGRAQVEAVPRFREAELRDEDLGHRVVPVLPGVQHDLLDLRLAERGRERCRLDELRPVSDDGEDLHAAGNTTARPGR